MTAGIICIISKIMNNEIYSEKNMKAKLCWIYIDVRLNAVVLQEELYYYCTYQPLLKAQRPRKKSFLRSWTSFRALDVIYHALYLAQTDCIAMYIVSSLHVAHPIKTSGGCGGGKGLCLFYHHNLLLKAQRPRKKSFLRNWASLLTLVLSYLMLFTWHRLTTLSRSLFPHIQHILSEHIEQLDRHLNLLLNRWRNV